MFRLRLSSRQCTSVFSHLTRVEGPSPVCEHCLRPIDKNRYVAGAGRRAGSTPGSRTCPTRPWFDRESSVTGGVTSLRRFHLPGFNFLALNIKFFMQFARNPVSYAPISATQQFRHWTRQESCNVTGCNLVEILCGAGFPEGGARV